MFNSKQEPRTPGEARIATASQVQIDQLNSPYLQQLSETYSTRGINRVHSAIPRSKNHNQNYSHRQSHVNHLRKATVLNADAKVEAEIMSKESFVCSFSNFISN